MNFSVLPYQPNKAPQVSHSATVVVTVSGIGASTWPGQPPSAHTDWNCSMSPYLPTAAVIQAPFFSITANVALM